MNVTLLAPEELPHPTGGFRFNRRIADELSDDPRFNYVNAECTGTLSEHDPLFGMLDGVDLLLLDSLYLPCEELQRYLVRLGVRFGWIVHAVASQMEGREQPSVAERRALERGTLAVVPSRYMRDWVKRWTAVSSVVVVSPAVDPPPSVSRAAAADAVARLTGGARNRASLVLLTVGSLSPVKNQRWLAELLSRRTDFHWILVGSRDADPEYAASFDECCRRIGIDGSVTVSEPLPHHDLMVLMQGADAYLQPSRFESFGMAAAEARTAGLPVIASPVGGLPEAVGPDGFICALGDASSWHQALDRIANGAAARRPEPIPGGPTRLVGPVLMSALEEECRIVR